MPKFFVTEDTIENGIIKIVGDDSHHISHSLRMRSGESITVSDGVKNYQCKISTITSDYVLANIEIIEDIKSEPPYEIILLQALPKSDKMDEIVKQTVECGVSKIVPFYSSRCIAHPDEKTAQKKIERWNRIAKEAAMQCGRGIIPSVSQICSYKEAINVEDCRTLKLFFYEGETVTSLPKYLSTKSCIDFDKVVVVVGSEGGFSIEEAKEAEANGFVLCGLGNRILRCENAPVVALSCISYQFEM